MADKTNSLYGMICEIVRQETIYLRHYIGQVLSNTDEENIGCVQVAIPELGWTTEEESPWCYPRERHAMSVPLVGEWVEVYFLSGNIDKPVYIGNCGEMKKDDNKNCIPEWFDGYPETRVIYQSPNSKKGIKLNETDGIMTIDSDEIELIDGSEEPFVLGDKLESYLTDFINNAFNLHTHPYVDTPVGASVTSPPSVSATAPTDILSEKIRGQ